ncbi:signal peptidase II [Allobranchiibius huperziae]|uniref:Lipoprotein signal peptidase n=1 Tax=Allobranchiibius huperziae TaxID=1874116 RepID=A0A853DCN0_9MICO|nr:signal peptidase II [Allobranchiibius huperziae]NYJ75102.1 signal peptidase II [Allobranchiibius huperziae]
MQTEAGTPLTTSAGPRRTPTRTRLLTVLGSVAVLGYLLDQGTKAWANAALDPARPRDLVGPVLKLHLTHNAGAAFSMATNATWVLTLIAMAVIAATIFAARRIGSRAWAVALGLLLAGAFGNLTDRFVRPPRGGQGHVVDFLELPHWPIFNVADMCVVCAAALIALLAIRGIGIDGRRAGASGDTTDAGERTDTAASSERRSDDDD